MSSDSGPPSNFSLSGPSDFRHAQGWDATQNKIVQTGDMKSSEGAGGGSAGGGGSEQGGGDDDSEGSDEGG